ncbi:SMI1/KNR4 family protein [Streptomyces sp. MUM 203J]|uniref:SMI1/KNR4 family protein n=1 Tax=Streptomyces sp. MUM 203J TaxID=2791990 RepID=UPI001F0340B3|nr:SMI1/KNR4 family protein [Streptomyces sp. MUM 203J]MCH0542360.1 SMI1/KNR4 family protein [Streptomyces sp. MUM 203J]
MDDLIGTQHPRRRFTDPGEAVAALEAAVPGLVAHRRSAPAPPDWSVIEARLGTLPPADFRLLSEIFGPFELDGFLNVRLPGPGREESWLRGLEHFLEIAQEWWEDDMSIGLRPHPAPGGLLPWGESVDGDLFFWTTTGAGPDDWTVTVAARSHGWWHYTGGVAQFVADWIDGGLERWELPPLGTGIRPY